MQESLSTPVPDQLDETLASAAVQRFSEIPRISPRSRTCVRWNPKAKRYELVVGGEILASISRLGMKIRAERKQFEAKVTATAQVVRMKTA